MVIQLSDTPGSRFRSITDELNNLCPTIVNGEEQFGILGLVVKVENYLKSILERKLGIRVVFSAEKSAGYLQGVAVSGKFPVLTLKRKLSLDIINFAKKGNVKPVIDQLRQEITNHVKRVREGDLGENGDLKGSWREYIMFEVEGCLPADSQGTLASFKAALPVDKLSLVDTDKERDYIPKEYKKDHFILKPTKEYLQTATLNALYNKGLSELDLRRYLHIARIGKYKIIKEHISESVNYQYRTLGDRITVSPISYSKEK